MRAYSGDKSCCVALIGDKSCRVVMSGDTNIAVREMYSCDMYCSMTLADVDCNAIFL